MCLLVLSSGFLEERASGMGHSSCRVQIWESESKSGLFELSIYLSTQLLTSPGVSTGPPTNRMQKCRFLGQLRLCFCVFWNTRANHSALKQQSLVCEGSLKTSHGIAGASHVLAIEPRLWRMVDFLGLRLVSCANLRIEAYDKRRFNHCFRKMHQ
jgi:hypothetical protein